MLNVGLELINTVIEISKRAGNEILKIYATDFQITTKLDKTPVTEADQKAEILILRSIREGVTDKFPIVSEEAATNREIPDFKETPFWLVDPLDGTKEFIKRNDEFTVNIALIENNRPIVGVITIPAKDTTYWGSIHGSYVQRGGEAPLKISCRPPPSSGLCAVLSRSHITPDTYNYLSNFSITQKISAGSSLKFCLIAEGKADLYPRLGKTMEWDTAAGHAILRFAGGKIETIEGKELIYGKKGLENPHFIASCLDFESKN